MTDHRTVQYYDSILEAVQRGIPGSAHIAGGAIRDSLLGARSRTSIFPERFMRIPPPPCCARSAT